MYGTCILHVMQLWQPAPNCSMLMETQPRKLWWPWCILVYKMLKQVNQIKLRLDNLNCYVTILLCFLVKEYLIPRRCLKQSQREVLQKPGDNLHGLYCFLIFRQSHKMTAYPFKLWLSLFSQWSYTPEGHFRTKTELNPAQTLC